MRVPCERDFVSARVVCVNHARDTEGSAMAIVPSVAVQWSSDSRRYPRSFLDLRCCLLFVYLRIFKKKFYCLIIQI